MTDIAEIIRQAAARYGQDPTPWLRAAQIESSNNPNTVQPGSRARGLFQFIPSTWAQYGRGDINDPAANADAAMRLAQDNSARFRSTFGRNPTAGEVYLMHQQGAQGATKLLQNPNAPAASIVGAPAVLQNGGRDGMTAGEFANMWTSKFDGPQMAQGATSQTASPSGAPAPTVSGAPMANALAAVANAYRAKTQPRFGLALNDGSFVPTSAML